MLKQRLLIFLGLLQLNAALLEKANITIDEHSPEAIVLGYDTEVSYEKLSTAALLMQKQPQIRYYATHMDNVCPAEKGNIPDIGSFIALFEKTTQRIPDKIFGKPNPEMIEGILRKHQVCPGEAIFFGDRVYTDYEMAKKNRSTICRCFDRRCFAGRL